MKDQVSLDRAELFHNLEEEPNEYFQERNEQDELFRINEKPNDDDIDRYKETKDE